MAKYELRLKARALRSQGESVKEIARKIGISKSTCSLWVKDIILSIEQLERLRKRAIEKSEVGRLKGAFIQKQRRLQLMEDFKIKGAKEIGNLKKNEFFLVGLALYWAEGCKKTRGVQFCNSDPSQIKIMVKWFKNYFDIKNYEIKARVGVNIIHQERDEIIKKYWSKIAGIPLKQFTKTSFKNVKSQKVYENFDEHYGTLSLVVLKPARFYYKIMGLIYGLSEAGCRLVSRGVS